LRDAAVTDVASRVRELDDEGLQDVLDKTKGPVLVDFWSPLCAPCRPFADVVSEVATEVGDNVVVGKLDISANQRSAETYRIQSVPTVLIFVDGKPVRRIVGARPKTHLLREISAFS
jgi:thioredoxin 1